MTLMITRIATATALGLILATSAYAQTSAPTGSEPAAPPIVQKAPEQPAAAPAATPTAPAATPAAPAPAAPAPQASAPATLDSAEACINAAATLGQAAEGKTLAEDKIDKLDALFSKMETLCDGKQYSEAMGIAKDIQTMLDGQ